jgi:hypothetical protein
MDTVPVLQSELTCPRCGFVSVETMPTDACVYFHECGSCRTLLRPKAGDCCVFCSFGSVKCPPVQQAGGCCCTPQGDSGERRGRPRTST